MKTVTSVLFLAALAGGCVHRRVTVVSHDDSAPVYDDGGSVEVYDDDPYFEDDFVDTCDPVWDGHTFIVVENHVHDAGCGHFFHNGYWHLFPEHHVYVDVGYSHCGDHGDFIRAGVHWTRVWDGGRFVMLCRHVHGPGCGHYFHSGCWHLHPARHEYASHRQRHFDKSCEVASAPSRRRESYEKGQAYREGSREVRQYENRRPAASKESRGGAYSVREPEARQEPGRARGGQAKQRASEPYAVREPSKGQPKQGQAESRQEPSRGAEKRSTQEKAYRRGGRQESSRQEAPSRVERPSETRRSQEEPRRVERSQKQEAPRQVEAPQRPQRQQEPPRRQEPPKQQAQGKQQKPEKQEKQEKQGKQESQGKQEKSKEPKKK